MNTQKYDRNALLDTLRGEVIQVTFSKVDGSERVMLCTINPALIPSEFYPKIEANGEPIKTIKENLNIIRAFDIEKLGWRSFRIDSIKSVIVP